MKFKFKAKTELNTPMVGVCQPGECVEYEDDDPRCQRLLRSSFFERIKKIEPEKVKGNKKMTEDNEEE